MGHDNDLETGEDRVKYKYIHICIYAYYSQNPYKVQFERVTSFLITQSSTFRGNPAVPDAKVISDTYQNPGAGNWSCRNPKLKMLLFYSMRKGNNSGGKNSNTKKRCYMRLWSPIFLNWEKTPHHFEISVLTTPLNMVQDEWNDTHFWKAAE